MNTDHKKKSAQTRVTSSKTFPCCLAERRFGVFWHLAGILGIVNAITVWSISKTSGTWQLLILTAYCQLYTQTRCKI